MRLTGAERALLFHGGAPRIVRAGSKPRPSEPGEVTRLSAKLSIETLRVPKTKKGEWRVDYLIRDDRPKLMRRIPKMSEAQVNEHGDPVPHSKEAIEAARLDGSYTTSSHGSVSSGGEAVDDFTLRRLTEDARRKERQAAADLLVAAEDVRDALKERLEDNPEFRRVAGRTIWRLRSELDKLIEKTRRQAA